MTRREKEFQTPPQFTYPALLRLIKSLQYDYLIHYDTPGGKRTAKMKRAVREQELTNMGLGSNWHQHFPSRRIPHGEFVLGPIQTSTTTTTTTTTPIPPTLPPPSSLSLPAYLNLYPQHLPLIFLHPRVSKYLTNYDPTSVTGTKPVAKKGVQFNLDGGFGVIKGSTRGEDSESDDDDDDGDGDATVAKVKCVTFAPYCYVGQIPSGDTNDDWAGDEVEAELTANNNNADDNEEALISYTQIDQQLINLYRNKTKTMGKTIFPTLLWAKLSLITFPWDQVDPTCYPELPRPTKNRLAQLIRDKSRTATTSPTPTPTPTSTTAKVPMPISKFQLLAPFIYQLTIGDGIPHKEQSFILQSIYNRLVLVGESWPQAWDFFDHLRQAAISTANQQRVRSNQYKGKAAVTSTPNTTATTPTTITEPTPTPTPTTPIPNAFPSHINASAAVNKTVAVG